MIAYKHHVHKGRIAVYSERHKLLESRLYYTSEGMKKVMEQWMKSYPYEGFYIQVRPYAEEKKVIRVQIPEKVERMSGPPAVYDNKSNYVYR